MPGKVVSSALLGVLAQAITIESYTEFGATTPEAITPTSSTVKQFGQIVAVSNELIAVSSNELVMDYGSTGEIATRGRVTVFGADYLRRFQDSGVDFTSSKTNDGYGHSLALWQGTMLVGAPTDSSSGENAGKAYVYYGTNLGSKQTLTADKVEAGDYFGYSVAIVHGQSYYGTGMAVVGAYGHDHDKESTVGQGCVFVYTMDQYSLWNLVGKLEPQDFEHKDHGGFGYSLAAYGNTVAVGTYSTDKAFVFELLGHLHECPHDQNSENFPSACLDEEDATDDAAAEVVKRRHLRSLQGRPEDNKKWYTEFQYEHIMTAGIEEEHKPEKEKQANSYSFGHSLSLYNASGILTLAVGAPDGVDDNNVHVGLVYVMSIMNRGDVQDNWYPEGYDHHDEDKRREEAEREAEREAKEAEEQERKEQEEAEREAKEAEEQERKEQEEAEREEREQNDHKRSLQADKDKNRFRTWNPQTNDYCGDKMGNFWILEAILAGSQEDGRFGHSMDISDNTLLIGTNPETFQAGSAVYFKRTAGTGGDDIAGIPLKSGPLYNTVWKYVSALQDSLGMEGDHFGYSVAFDGDIAVVGSIMPDIQPDGTFGQGVAYVYDRARMVTSAPTPSPTPYVVVDSKEETLMGEMTNTHTALGISFLSSIGVIGFAVIVVAGYTMYRGAGGESSLGELCGFSSTSAPKQVRLATMDDSGYSTSSQQGLKSAYTGLDTSSTHGQNRLPSRGPAPSPRGSSGASRTFTPQAKRTFTPKPRPDANVNL